MKNPLNSKSFKVLKEQGFKKWILYRCIKIQAILLNFFPFLFKTLPSNYKFVIYCFSASGHFALNYFLSLCGLNKVEFYHDVLDYVGIREKLKKEDKNFYLHFFFSRKKQFIPNFSYILNSTKILILTRDPISRFKTFINHGKSNDGKKIINLNDDLNEVFKILYLGKRRENEVKPSLKALKYWKNSNKTLNFNHYSNIKAFLESKKEFKIFYIDCKELDSKIAFNTMNKLAKILDFNPPNIKDKEKFEHKFWNK
ncbi:DUF2972 domain-containing protein, partial [Campylobacter novaezeelandiae]|uniref:DUF2972 domain-containing protein n=1 Tax=Campylobacter novaezeelandiae TaxID=2267891 RepID=UPI0010371EA8